MAVLAGVLPVFLIIALGAMARRLGWIGDAFVVELNRVIYLLAIPALLIRVIGRTDLGESLSWQVVVATCAATVVTAVVVAALVLARRTEPTRAGVLVQAAVRGNLAYVGFPVIAAVAGEGALRAAAVTAAILIPVQNLVSITALAAAGGRGFASVARRVVLNPVVLGAAGGIAWSLSGWHGWRWLVNLLDILGDLAMPGALLALGGQLSLERIQSDLRPALLATVAKVAIAPAVCLGFLVWLQPPAPGMLVGLFLLATPTAVASTAIAQEMGGDLDLAGAAVVTSTLAAFPAYVVWSLVVS